MSGHTTMIVRATVDDPVDGVMRLLGDVQRFGFALQSLALEAQMRPWAAAAILGGVAAGLYALSTRRRRDAYQEPEIESGLAAHQTDGRDSSRQMEAMIADENMVPERLP